MKRMMIGLIGIAASLATAAWADSAPYYICQAPLKGAMNIPYRICGEAVLRSARRMYQFTDQNGRQFMDNATILVFVQCKGGTCAESLEYGYGNFTGHAPDGNYYVQRGYQLAQDTQGNLGAWHPEAIQQGMHQQQASVDAHSADLYCSNMSDTCTVTKNGQEQEVDRANLPQHLDFYRGDADDCISEACWGDKGEFLGLNPDYYQQ